MAVISTSQLHNAFSEFVLHLRDKSIDTENEISQVSDRVEILEMGGGVGGEALVAHIEDPEPHVAYDRDMPDFTVLFNNLIA